MLAIRGLSALARRTDRLTRRRFLGHGVALAGGIVGLGLLDTASILAPAASATPGGFGRRGGDPRPIPGGFDQNLNPVPVNPLVHVLPPAVGFDMSTIFDFNGVVAAGGPRSGRRQRRQCVWFDADMRFMKGAYMDVNGRMQEHSFGFV